jgi:UDP-glucose 4-epimerase
MSNILLTGGLGFIGSHTVVALVQAGYKPVIVDDLSNSHRKVLGGIEAILGHTLPFYQNDYRDEEFMSRLIKKHKITGVIHFAAFKSVNQSVEEPLLYYQNNVAGFINLLNVVKQSSIKHIVFSSSAAVYGNPDRIPLTEDAELKAAASPYGSTKLMCETILRDVMNVQRAVHSIALRYFNPIGAHDSGLIGELPLGVPANLVPFVTQAAAGVRPKLTIFGDDYDTPDGTCIRDYIHVTDLARAHVKALEFVAKSSAPSFSAINIGTGQGTSVLEVVRTFEKVTGVPVPYKIGPRRPGDVVTCYSAVDKAHKLLAWKAELSLERSLADAWRWQQSQQPS